MSVIQSEDGSDVESAVSARDIAGKSPSYNKLREILLKHDEKKHIFVVSFPSDNQVTIVPHDTFWEENRRRNIKSISYPRIQPFLSSKKQEPYDYVNDFLQKGDKVRCSMLLDDGTEMKGRKTGRGKKTEYVRRYVGHIELITTSKEVAEEAVMVLRMKFDVEKDRKLLLAAASKTSASIRKFKEPPPPPPKADSSSELDLSISAHYEADAESSNSSGTSQGSTKEQMASETNSRKRRRISRGYLDVGIEEKKRRTIKPAFAEKITQPDAKYEVFVRENHLDSLEYIRNPPQIRRRNGDKKEPDSPVPDECVELENEQSPWFFQIQSIQNSRVERVELVEDSGVWVDEKVFELISSYNNKSMSLKNLIWYMFCLLIGGEGGLRRLNSIFERKKAAILETSPNTIPVVHDFTQAVFGKEFFRTFKHYMDVGVHKEEKLAKIWTATSYPQYLNEKLTCWRTWEKYHYLVNFHREKAVELNSSAEEDTTPADGNISGGADASSIDEQ